MGIYVARSGIHCIDMHKNRSYDAGLGEFGVRVAPIRDVRVAGMRAVCMRRRESSGTMLQSPPYQ
jgi:hypothetical protein